MSLKAGRVGVAPDQVTELGKIKGSGDYYTKTEIDGKFEEVGEDLDALAEDISDINLKVPFSFGVDMTDPSNPVYGYKKAGADTVTPFKSSDDGNIVDLNLEANGYTINLFFKYDGEDQYPGYDLEYKIKHGDFDSGYKKVNFIDKQNGLFMIVVKNSEFITSSNILQFNIRHETKGLQYGRKSYVNLTNSNYVNYIYMTSTSDIKDGYMGYGYSFSS